MGLDMQLHDNIVPHEFEIAISIILKSTFLNSITKLMNKYSTVHGISSLSNSSRLVIQDLECSIFKTNNTCFTLLLLY